jgi:hypothetical protein
MHTQNVTLSIPKAVLHKAKRLALERGTSLSGLLTQAIQELVEAEDEYEAARARHLWLLSDPPDLGTNGRATWKRDDLHER